MRLILFRHGPAGTRDAARWPDDGLRPLTSRGEERTYGAAAGLAKLEPEIRIILTSPLTRAAQTARALEGTLDHASVEILEALGPGGSYRKIVEALGRFADAEAVALVGHEPDLGKLAGTLVFGAPSALPLKKAGACAIQFDGAARPGAGRMVWLLTPKLLRRQAGKKDRV
jgi:phosphohistidine phosphatase